MHQQEISRHKVPLVEIAQEVPYGPGIGNANKFESRERA